VAGKGLTVEGFSESDVAAVIGAVGVVMMMMTL
jgi:hypothetical protein